MPGTVEMVRGKRVVIHFDGEKCVRARQCVLSRPDVFGPNGQGLVIDPDAASPEEIAQIVRSCPSGALTCERLDGGPQEEAPLVNTVQVRENGPLAFRAQLSLPSDLAGYRATLCRCGASRRKPWCDGSHVATGFSATGEPPAKSSEPLKVRKGPLTVTPIPDGPLKVEGPLEVISGTGRTLDRTTETYLCRCGASATKPWCDGSHRKIGFRGS